MRIIKFDRDQAIPLVRVEVKGPRTRRRATLVFDTGAAMTQIDTRFLEYLGYSATDGKSRISIIGATGETQEGYTIEAQSLMLFGKRFENLMIAAMDFDSLGEEQIDGLLGFDIVKELHIEVNGPIGMLIVHD